MAEVVGGALTNAFRRREQALLLAGAALVILAAAIAPLAQMFLELLRSQGSGLALLGTARTWALLGRSLLLAGGVTATALAIGIPLGLVLGRGNLPFRRALWVAHSVPMFLPPVVPALGWFHWLGAQGIAGGEMTARLLFSEAGLIAVLGTTFAPVVTSLVALGIWGVDASLEEAARVVARPWRVATRILLPSAAPAIALGAIIVYALALSELGVPMFLRVDVFPAAVFARLGGVDFAPGEALALALPLLPVALGLVALERRFAARRAFAVLGLRGGAREPFALGRWRLAALVACLAAAAVSAGPIAALVIRSVGAGGGVSAAFEWAGQAPWNGLLAGAAGATIVTAVAIVAGHAVARSFRGAMVLDGLSMLAFVTPAAVLGVGLIALWNRPATQLVYGTLAILVVGYVARYSIVGIRVVACVVAQSPANLEEAASTSGARFGRRLWRIVLPLHARGVAFAWLLAFVFCLRDLETAILFYPPGREPLTVRIFTLEANGPPAVVAGLCVLQIGLTASALALGRLAIGRRK